MADHFLVRCLAFPTPNSPLRKAAVGRRKCQFSQSVTEIELHTWNAVNIHQRRSRSTTLGFHARQPVLSVFYLNKLRCYLSCVLWQTPPPPLPPHQNSPSTMTERAACLAAETKWICFALVFAPHAGERTSGESQPFGIISAPPLWSDMISDRGARRDKWSSRLRNASPRHRIFICWLVLLSFCTVETPLTVIKK